jgi:kinesin family protein 5
LLGENQVRVICRFRPANDRERRENVAAKQAEGLALDVLDSHTINVVGPGSKEVLTFSFDHVFNESAPQRQVYEITARETVNDMLDGYNGTIFAYGQTGAGKTYTMTSNLSGSAETRGIVPRACSQLFSHIEQDTSGTEYTIKCSFLEIYKEGLRDLLDPKSQTKLKIRETPTKGVWVEGLTEAFVGSENDILTLLQLGEQSRSVASTNMNAVSSRSHTLFVITLVQKLKDGSTKLSRLNLADLAGSEKVGKTGATGETLEEAKKINQSLSALGNCIVALTKSADKRKHVPYRDSKLTFILRESLGGNSKTTLLIACSPHLYNLEETISTLRFGQRAKSIKNQVKINAHRSVAELELIVSKLQAEVGRLRAYSKVLEQELTTRLPADTVDLKSLQEKAWKTIKDESTESTLKPTVSLTAPYKASLQASTSSSPSPSNHPSTLAPEKPTNRGKRSLSNSADVLSPMAQSAARKRSDSEHHDTMSIQSSPSPSLSFLTSDTASDSGHSEDSDFWTPMNLVEAQLAYDRMKEDLEFKLQDALEDLAAARDEAGIEELKSKLTREFEEYKASSDAKLLEVQDLSSKMMAEISSAAEQAESLAEQLDTVSEQKEALEIRTQQLLVEIATLKDIHAFASHQQKEELERQIAQEKELRSADSQRLEDLLAEQTLLTNSTRSSLDEATSQMAAFKSEVNSLKEARDAAKTMIASLQFEVDALKAASLQKDAQLLESTATVTRLEIRLQDYMGRAEQQGKASDEGMKLLGDLNKTLTEKNQSLFEEKNLLTSKQTELQIKLTTMQNELESSKQARSADQARLSSLDIEMATIKSELDSLKTSSTKRAQQLELHVKDLEKAVVEQQRSTLQAELNVERSRVEAQVAATETVRVRAELEKELASVREKSRRDLEVVESSLSAKTRSYEEQSEQLKALQQQHGDLKLNLERLGVQLKALEESSTKRVQQLEEELTDARVALRKAKESLESIKDERDSLTAALEASASALATPPVTPAKSYSMIGRDPTAHHQMKLDSHFGSKMGNGAGAINSRISVPVTNSLSGHMSGAAALLSSRTATPSHHTGGGGPTKAAASLLNTPLAGTSGAKELSLEKSAWFQICICHKDAQYSSGWKRLWVVVKDRKVSFYENQDMRTIVDAVQIRGCQLLQMSVASLVDQPTEHCFVLISPSHGDKIGLNGSADIDAEEELHQDEYAFCAQSSDLMDSFVQHFLRLDCEPLAFSTLQLESVQPQPAIVAPPPSSATKSGFSRLAQGSSQSSSSTPSNQAAPRSFLSGLFG